MHRTAIRALARGLMNQHGLRDWSLTFGSAKNVAGSCSFSRRTIRLSAALMENWSESAIRNTILHEIAHALAGPRAGHGPTWRRVARQIGCTGDRCWTPSAESPKLPPTWIGTCPAGHTSGRHRRPTRVVSCGRCSRRFSEAHLLVWERAGLVAA